MKNELTFQDGIILCKYIYQSAIDKTLNGIFEQEEIFFKAHRMLEKIIKDKDKERLNELLYLLNLDDVYLKI